MKYRKLRITWSIAWGVVCLLLIALWVRSYWWWDYAILAIRSDGEGVSIQSVQGHLPAFHTRAGEYSRIGSIELASNPALSDWQFKSFYFERGSYQTIAGVPHWFALLCTGFIATIPWLIRWRFSLRALLIGLTVAAIGLGWLVYTLRK